MDDTVKSVKPWVTFAGGVPVISDCVVTENGPPAGRVDSGRGVEGGNIVIRRSTISANGGGGVSIGTDGTLEVTDSLISGNRCPYRLLPQTP